MFYCNALPFTDLGFIQQDENLWVKYTNGGVVKPYFVLTTTVNPISMTFLIKDLINNKMFSTNDYESIKEFVLSTEREDKLKKLLD